MDRPDATLIANEFRHVARMLILSCRMWIARLRHGIHLPVSSLPEEDRQNLSAEIESLLVSHPLLWSHRSRPGGLDESSVFLQRVVDAMAGKDNGDPQPPTVESPLLAERDREGRMKTV